MSVSRKGSHIGMPLDMATPDTKEAEKRGPQEASPTERAHHPLPDDVIEDGDEVFEDALDVGEVFF